MKKVLIVNTSVDESLAEFTDVISKRVSQEGFSPSVIHYTQLPQTDLNEYQGIILSPAAMDLKSDSPKLENEWEHRVAHSGTLKKYTGPLLGSCAGHQLIGLLYGSEYLRNKEVEEGDDCTVQIRVKNDPIFQGISNDEITVKQLHSNSITLPEDFILLASSDVCKVQLIRHKSRMIYGAQFHIEEDVVLFSNFLNML